MDLLDEAVKQAYEQLVSRDKEQIEKKKKQQEDAKAKLLEEAKKSGTEAKIPEFPRNFINVNISNPKQDDRSGITVSS
jgi:hypothetical protein